MFNPTKRWYPLFLRIDGNQKKNDKGKAVQPENIMPGHAAGVRNLLFRDRLGV